MDFDMRMYRNGGDMLHRGWSGPNDLRFIRHAASNGQWCWHVEFCRWRYIQ